jgi:hypothetical protein
MRSDESRHVSSTAALSFTSCVGAHGLERTTKVRRVLDLDEDGFNNSFAARLRQCDDLMRYRLTPPRFADDVSGA